MCDNEMVIAHHLFGVKEVTFEKVFCIFGELWLEGNAFCGKM